MKLQKAQNRERKRNKKINGHKEDGRSVKYIRQIQKDKAEKIKKKREKKEEILDLTLAEWLS